MSRVTAVLASLCLLSPGTALAQTDEPSPLERKIEAALASDARTPAERARDANRRPSRTLEFLRMSHDMRVLELVPGGGWYTKILAPVLAERGELYVALGTDRVETELAGKSGFEHVRVLPVEAARDRVGRRLELAEFELEVRDVDLALTFRNLHNFTEKGRASINRAVFAALKPGGLYGVVDHTRRHMQGEEPENWRRMDPVRMILEIQAAGFELLDSSDLHYRPDDELRYEVGRRSVAGNTDRFTLLFRKPE